MATAAAQCDDSPYPEANLTSPITLVKAGFTPGFPPSPITSTPYRAARENSNWKNFR